MTTPYPTELESIALFDKYFRGDSKDMEGAKNQLANDFTWDPPHSLKEHFSNEHQGVDAMMTTLKKVEATADSSQPSGLKILRAMGGGHNPYVAIELEGTGTSTTGKQNFNNSVMIIRFNSARQMDYASYFPDSHHMHEHLKDAGQI